VHIKSAQCQPAAKSEEHDVDPYLVIISKCGKTGVHFADYFIRLGC